jgi:mannose-6-phosphate isomerase-like protein (cupin superfamily)
MHHVGSLTEIAARTPWPYERHSQGYSRSTYVDHVVGSVHMGVGRCALAPGGAINPHVHAFEESFYILEGSLVVQMGEQAFGLGPGHHGLIGTGVPHAFRNAGEAPARWLEMQAPQPRPAEVGRDTFFVGGEAPAEASTPDPADLAAKMLGYFDESLVPRPGGPSQMEGFNPTTGVALKMFVDRSFGAIHQSLFFLQYMPGAKIDPHDHTFEESYLILSGQVQATADGRTYTLGPGSTFWTGVGCIHSFANVSDAPVRWLETQAPLPPAKEVFRFERDWAQYADA